MKALLNVMLKGAVVGTVATLLAVGCGDNNDDNDNPGGEAGEGGSGGSSGGTKNQAGTKSDAGDGNGGAASPGAGAPGEGGSGAATGGAATGGAPEGGSAGGESGPDPFAEGGAGLGGASYEGPAIAKFCNSLTFGPEGEEMPTTFRLEIGEGNDKVTFTASTGECAPADGDACTVIPTGEAVPIRLFDVDGQDPLDDATGTITADEQYVFITDLDTSGAEPFPIWNALFVNPKFTCEDVTYTDTF
jgi:hypothetical protein